MAGSLIRLDVVPVHGDGGPERYRWILQRTAPLTNLFTSCDSFETRAEAVADFTKCMLAIGLNGEETTDESA